MSQTPPGNNLQPSGPELLAPRRRTRFESEPVDVRMSRFEFIHYLRQFTAEQVDFYKRDRFDDPLTWVVAIAGFVSPLVPGDFQDFGPANASQWQLLFVLATIASTVMLIRSVMLQRGYRKRKTPRTPDEYCDDITTGGDWTEARISTEPTGLSQEPVTESASDIQGEGHEPTPGERPGR